MPSQYLADMSSVNLVGAVHVQANSGAQDPVDETRWLDALADQTGWPSAIVAEVDLTDADALAQIDRHRQCQRLRGIRTPVAWDAAGRWRVAARPGVLSDPSFRKAAAALVAHDLTLDMVVVPDQLSDVAALSSTMPGLKIVINHFGTLEPDQLGNEQTWRDGIDQLSQCPNVFLKLSGLWTVDRGWSADVLNTHIGFALDGLSSQRVMYGSNMPVEGVNSRVDQHMKSLSHCLRDLPATDLHAIFHDTAKSTYRL